MRLGCRMKKRNVWIGAAATLAAAVLGSPWLIPLILHSHPVHGWTDKTIAAKNYDRKAHVQIGGDAAFGLEIVRDRQPPPPLDVFNVRRVEYDIEFPREGSYDVLIRYAAGESRPVAVFLAGQERVGLVAATGGWTLAHQEWTSLGPFNVKHGRNTLRISSRVGDRISRFPHLEAIRLRWSE